MELTGQSRQGRRNSFSLPSMIFWIDGRRTAFLFIRRAGGTTAAFSRSEWTALAR
jgi:hypothetical protein